MCVCVYIYTYMYDLALSAVSDIHWGSWNVFPMDKGSCCI